MRIKGLLPALLLLILSLALPASSLARGHHRVQRHRHKVSVHHRRIVSAHIASFRRHRPLPARPTRPSASTSPSSAAPTSPGSPASGTSASQPTTPPASAASHPSPPPTASGPTPTAPPTASTPTPPPVSTPSPAAPTPSPTPPAPSAPAITGTTYYVSPSGSDSDSGTSPDHAWRTVGRANSADLHPGDGVLFQGGATFSDNTLMPTSSGAPGQPIVFGSYGTGLATLTQGAWFIDKSYLSFDSLAFGPQAGFQGGNTNGHPSSHIVLQRCNIDLGSGAPSNPSVGVNATGDDWTITGNTVRNIGNSGMLLQGDNYTVSGNTIDRTGLDTSVPYGMHGIYLKVSNAQVTDNTITNFSADGISVRYRNSLVQGNTISGGGIGIAWFQADSLPGTSHWSGNVITSTTDAGIYVSNDTDSTKESFVITGNTIHTAGQPMNLKPTTGTYTVSGNTIQ